MACAQLMCGNICQVEDEEEEEERGYESVVASGKYLQNTSVAIWDDAAPVDMNAPHHKCSALKCANGSMRFGTRLKSLSSADIM